MTLGKVKVGFITSGVCHRGDTFVNINLRPCAALLAEAHAAEPRYWGYDTTRAISRLPRWYGQPGEWEA